MTEFLVFNYKHKYTTACIFEVLYLFRFAFELCLITPKLTLTLSQRQTQIYVISDIREPIITKISTPTMLSSMKRSQLQKLCKKYGLKANGKNTDLQEKLQQYALNSGEDIDMEDIEMIYNPDIDKSSQRIQYANSISEPTTPQTPSIIPLGQQNKVRSSLVDDSPIKTSQHEITENKIEISHNTAEQNKDEMEDVNIKNVDNQITDHLVSVEKTELNPILLNPTFEQVEVNVLDNMTESEDDEMEDVQITNHLVSVEETDLNPILLNPTYERVEIKDDITESKMEGEMEDVNIKNVDHITNNQITDHLVSDEKTDLNPIPLNPAFEQVEMSDNMTESKEDEMKDVNIKNVDHISNNQITDCLVSDEKTDLNPMPAFEQVEMNDIPSSKQDIIDSVHKELETRFAILKALPSPERKKILENSKIPTVTPLRRNSEASIIKQTGSSSANRFAQVHEKAFSQMPSIVSHYAAHKTKIVEEAQDEINRKRKDLDSTQPLIKKQKLAHKTQENQVIKSAKDVYKKDEVVKPVVKRSSIRLKNIFPNPEEQRKKEREEFVKRKQAARSVAQPVLEKMKNRKKSKENVEQKQSTQNIKKSILPRRVQQ